VQAVKTFASYFSFFASPAACETSDRERRGRRTLVLALLAGTGVLVGAALRIRSAADLLLTTAVPQRVTEIDPACWRVALRSERGTIFRRANRCA
jgi:hypothetical protein